MEVLGKVALVTGGGQGIGKAIAQRLLQEGYAVVIADIDGEAAEEAAGEYRALGAVAAMAVDVADEDAVAAIIGATIARFGRLDALVNNAGISDPGSQPVETLGLHEWHRIISTNLTGVFLCSRHAVAPLRESRGAIVNIASTRALQSEPHTEAYSASKGGVVALTHALAVSLGPQVRVNCISPGWIAVDSWRKRSLRKEIVFRPEDHAQHPAGRVGVPEDVAGMTVFLLSSQAQFITGQNFVVDGGMTRRMVYVE